MRKTIDDFRQKLIQKVTSAVSEDQIHRLVDAAMKILEKNKVHGHINARFVDKSIRNIELDLLEKMEKEQRDKLEIALSRFKEHKWKLTATNYNTTK